MSADCTILAGDVLARLAELSDASVQCVVTSPPYWGLRDYGVAGQIGLEATPEAYLAQMVAVFEQVRRVLRNDGTLWLNLGDCYASGGGNGDQGQSGQRANRRHTQKHLGVNRGRRQVGDNKNPKAGIPALGPNRTNLQGLKPKDLVGMPWRVAFALQAAGWWLRQDIIWHKPNPMPESVRDRCTKAHEYLFLLTKQARYFYDAEAVQESVSENTNPRISKAEIERIKAARLNGANTSIGMGGTRKSIPPDGMNKQNNSFENACCLPVDTRNKRSVWTIATEPFPEAHFATFPRALVEPCIRAGSKPGDVVLDPFMGSGTVGAVALPLGRRFVGIELNPEYVKLARKRITKAVGPLFAAKVGV